MSGPRVQGFIAGSILPSATSAQQNVDSASVSVGNAFPAAYIG